MEADSRISDISDALYRVAAKAVIFSGNKLLVVQETEGWYGLPGGGVGYGEEIQQALIREVKEELSVNLEASAISAQPQFVSNKGIVDKLPRLSLYYTVKTSNQQIQSLENAELNFKWVTMDEFDALKLSPGLVFAKQFLYSLWGTSSIDPRVAS